MKEILIGEHLCHVLGRSLGEKAKCWLDFDDVIINTGRSKELACKKLLGREIPAYLLDSAKLEQSGLTGDEYRQIQAAVYKGTMDNNILVSIAGAVEGINILIRHDIIPGILTARYDKNELGVVRNFFENIGIKVPIVGVGYQASKNGAKARVLEEVGARIYIDDDIKMINAILATGRPSYKLYLFDPEGHQRAPEGVRQVSSWNGIVEAIIQTYDR